MTTRQLTVPLRRRWIGAQAVFFAYLMALSATLSTKRMLWADEFLAWHILSDHSWRNAFESWSSGVDGGGFLFYVIGRSILAVVGLHPVAIRLYSAACIAIAGLIWFRILSKYVKLVPVLIAISLIWLCNGLFIDHLVEVRFYGQLVLAFSIVVAGMLWLEEHKPTPALCFTISFLTTTFLVLTHMLGVIYSAGLLLAGLMSRMPRNRKIASSAGMLSAWASLLLFHRAITSGANVLQWIRMPALSDVIRWYLHSPLFIGHITPLCIALNVGLWALVLLRMIWMYRNDTWRNLGNEQRLLLIIICLLALSPVGLYLASHIVKPLFTGRYFMPQLLCVAALFAFGMEAIPSPVPGLIRNVSASLLVIAIACMHALVIRDQMATFDSLSELSPLLAMQGSQPVVLIDDPLWEQLWFYGGKQGQRFHMLWPVGGPYVKPLLQYCPGVALDNDFLSHHSDFLVVLSPNAKILYGEFHETFLSSPEWTVVPHGTVLVRNVPAPVVELFRNQPPPAPVNATRP